MTGSERADRAFAARVGAAVACVLLGVLPAAALPPAGEIRVNTGNGCAAPVHLVARNAPLSDVLARLATSLDFEVSFESDNDPLVNVDVSRPLADLVMQLAPLENLSVAQVRDPHCPQRDRIVKIWVLPAGNGGAIRTAMETPDARLAREAAERLRKGSAGVDHFLGAHGLAPQSGQ